jgi:hypothetical protein
MYAPGIPGKYLFRIREAHIRDHYIPLMTKKSLGTVKLDLALRGLALLPAHAGKRDAGLILPGISYEVMHDLVREPNIYATSHESEYDADSPVSRKLKREWVREQLSKLESMDLVKRSPRTQGGRPTIHVLRDDGSKLALDDPTGSTANSYTTILGGIFTSGTIRQWDTPELSFFFAAMVAERHHRYRTKDESALGAGQWYQALSWFADKADHRPANHVRLPFSTATLDRGLRKFLAAGLIEKVLTRNNPRGGKFNRGPRNIYTNHFDQLATPEPIDKHDLTSTLENLNVDEEK